MTSRAGGRLAPLLTNLALAGLWAAYGWGRYELWRRTQAVLPLVLLARNSVVTLLFLCRRPAQTASHDARDWAVAIAGTLVGFAYSEGAALFPRVGAGLMILAALLSTVASLALGRSFGIVPANRGLKTKGPYALVRHPIYFSYVVFDIGFLLQAASLRNGLVFAAMLVTTYLRGRFEERHLRLDAEFRAYTERTRYMFLPGVL